GEDLGLGGLVLGHALEDELTVGEVLQRGGDPYPACGRVGLLAVDLALVRQAGQRVRDPPPGPVDRGRSGDRDQHVQSRTGADLGDTGAHQPTADDSDPARSVVHRAPSVRQRSSALACAMPPPNPLSSTRSPSWRALDLLAASRVIATEALPVLP